MNNKLKTIEEENVKLKEANELQSELWEVWIKNYKEKEREERKEEERMEKVRKVRVE